MHLPNQIGVFIYVVCFFEPPFCPINNPYVLLPGNITPLHITEESVRKAFILLAPAELLNTPNKELSSDYAGIYSQNDWANGFFKCTFMCRICFLWRLLLCRLIWIYWVYLIFCNLFWFILVSECEWVVSRVPCLSLASAPYNTALRPYTITLPTLRITTLHVPLLFLINIHSLLTFCVTHFCHRPLAGLWNFEDKVLALS